MASSVHEISTSKAPLSRVLDSIDRGHARAADRLHTLRNGLRERIEHGLDRIERVVASAVTGVRARVERTDAVAADGIIRAQGVVGRALENARHARSPRA